MILSVRDSQGDQIYEPEAIKKLFLDFYKKHLGASMKRHLAVKKRIVKQGRILSKEQKEKLTLNFSDEDIRKAIFTISGVKSPGPDGYSAYFYHDSWDIVGESVIAAVQSCLEAGKILREINNTAITLIPKVTCPDGVGDYHPIACCNVIYKVMT